MVVSENIFFSARISQIINFRLDSAQEGTGELVNFIKNQRQAIELEIINRLNIILFEHGEKNSFGDFDYFIDSVVTYLLEKIKNHSNEKVLFLKSFLNSKQDIEGIIQLIKSNGVDWIPKKFQLTGKYVAVSLPVMMAIFEPLRVLFISSYLSKVKQDMLPLSIVMYLSILTTLSLQEIKFLKKNNPFVINPYVSILALKLRPELASLFTRLPRLVSYSVIGSSAYQISEVSRELIAPALFFISLWLLIELLGNLSLSVIFDYLENKDS